MSGSSGKRRSFLFLQGPCSPFFARLAAHLQAQGHRVHRLNFCAGDAAYWRQEGAWNFRGRPGELTAFLAEKYRRHGIGDQVLFGDCRPVHRPAIEAGRAAGVRTHVFEEGYFRPHWVTLEREGVNAHSLLPRERDWFREAARALGKPSGRQPFRSPFSVRAAHDVAYHLAGSLNPLLFPGYAGHAPVGAPLEYLGYLKRFATLRLIRRREQERARALAAGGRPYFLLPLQLNGDAQIRWHSRFAHMGEVIERVLSSFARQAPGDALLVIKNHPLDPGLMSYRRLLDDGERRFGLAGRIVYLEDGDLGLLAARARGMVTVNSTAGLLSLERGTPTFTLGDPIYRLPGLTCEGALDDFWRAPAPPDARLFSAFRRVVLHATQVNGGLYCAAGIALAVANGSRALTAERSPLQVLLARTGHPGARRVPVAAAPSELPLASALEAVLP